MKTVSRVGALLLIGIVTNWLGAFTHSELKVDLLASSAEHEPLPLRTLSCLPTPSPSEAFGKANVVFLGTALSSEFSTTEVGRTVAKFRVHRSWKGDVFPELVVESDLLSTGYTFEREGRYIVYAEQLGDVLWTDSCTRTTNDVKSELLFLPPGGVSFDHFVPLVDR